MTPIFSFRRIPRVEVTQALLDECAVFFSLHYGRWANNHPNLQLRGKPIKLSSDRIAKYITDDGWIATARTDDGALIGYAIAAWIQHGSGTISWVTQLIVHPDYRRKLVASRLLSSIWGQSNHFAWGLASANPFAIRALEKVTRRSCLPSEIVNQEKARIRAQKSIDYLKEKSTNVTTTTSTIDTEFCQDLSELPGMLLKAQEAGIPWLLGNLPPCQEWLAMTFRPQEAREWTQTEFEAFLTTSSEIVAQAYERMADAVPQTNHAWADPEKAKVEANYLSSKMGLQARSRILDFGCGSGRHSVALAELGYQVTGVDRSQTAIKQARGKIAHLPESIKPRFIERDILNFESTEVYDAGFCLYDVIGSYPDDRTNRAIFEKLLNQIKPGGWVVFSVMSFEYVSKQAKLCTSGDAQKHIANLKPSKLMEQSGEVFDPNYMIVDNQMRIVLRKEQFCLGSSLPEELLIADRRYCINEIHELCRGRIDIHHIGYVRAGQFQLVEQENLQPTKEILVIGKKSLI